MAPQPAGERAEIAIEQVQPVVDGGRFAAKAEVDRPIAVSADIFAYGHGLLAAEVRWQPSGGEWHSAPLGLAGNDRWTGSFACTVLGRCHFTIEAWRDVFASWRQDVIAKLVTEEDARPDVEAGLQLIRRALTLGQASDTAAAERFLRRCEGCSDAATLAVAARDAYPAQEMRRLAREVAGPTLSPHFPVQVDRPAARFSAWYEMFPRSQGQDLRRGSTLREAAIRLPDIAAMGFDVLYLPPIHPIGETGRKGRDNAPLREPGDPGSPWAIGGAAGGHKSVHPKLGTLTDFADFVEQARALHLEVALDYALQCSPDHPYVREHPDWFFRRPDGSIRYAENPPKKYQDIYPLNFYCDDRAALWDELKSIVTFWIDHQVRIFRVDNPHTKPFPFWEWLIGEVQREHPEVIFLAEAFTRPKVMLRLAKLGFSQSYTYFTWRNTPAELREYVAELRAPGQRDCFRPNFFANTPDILPAPLQGGHRAAFVTRLVLAATLSPAYGICNGFELCEGQAIPGTEEYLHSEKYQIVARSWGQPGNLRPEIRAINALRRGQPALQGGGELRFQSCDDEQVLAYALRSADGASIVFVAVSTDVDHPRQPWVQLPLDWLGASDADEYQVRDLSTGQRSLRRGAWQQLALDPAGTPFAILQLTPPAQ